MLVVRLAELEEVRDLQLSVLRPNGPLPADLPPPPGMQNVGAFEDGRPIGAASVVAAPWPGPGEVLAPTWQLRSVAVRADRRGSGVGRRVLDLAVQTAFDRGAATLWAAARLEALDFYTRSGWSVIGPAWVKAGVGPHRWITRSAGVGAVDD